MTRHAYTVIKTDTATLALTERGRIIANKATALTLSVLAASGNKGLWYEIINIGAGVCTVDEVAGATLITLIQNESTFVVCNGTTWYKTNSAFEAQKLILADAGDIITATEVEGALQENRTAINLNTAASHAQSHVILSADHTDTLADSVVAGDMMIGNATPKWARLAKGTALHTLCMNAGGTLPEWTAVTGTGNVVRATSPTLVTPEIGAATGTSLNLSGILTLVDTTTDATGVIYKGENPFIHNYTAAGADGANTFLGIDSGNFTMAISGQSFHASYNTGIGYGSLNFLTTGYYNSALGRNSLYANTTGYGNTGIGYASLTSNTTGYQNSAFGSRSLWHNQEGNNNTVLGWKAGYGVGLSNYSNNIFVGYQAGDSVTTGSNNIIIGYDQDMPTGATSNHLNIGGTIYGDISTGNVMIGTPTPNANSRLLVERTFTDVNKDELAAVFINATWNPATEDTTGVGRGLWIKMASSGTNNLKDLVGFQNRIDHASSGDALNVYGGYNKVFNTSTGTITNSYGFQIRSTVNSGGGAITTNYGLHIQSQTVGDTNYGIYVDGATTDNYFAGNVGIGETSPSQALDLIGSLELELTTTSTTGVIYKGVNRFIHDYTASGVSGANTFLGVGSGNFTMSGSGGEASYNTGAGYQSLSSLTSGYSNAAFGYNSLAANTTGYMNAAFGMQSLRYNEEGNNNTALGHKAGYGVSASNYSNNIFIGYQAGDSVTTGSNNIIIGYDQDMSAGNANDELNIGGLIYGNIGSAQVGINVVNPLSTLDVGGNIRLSGGTHDFVFSTDPSLATCQLQNQSAGQTTSLQFFTKDGDGTDDCNFFLYGVGTPDAWFPDYEAVRLKYENSTTHYELASVAGGTGTVRPLKLYTGANTSQLVLATDGNVGIGTTTPEAPLHVVITSGTSPIWLQREVADTNVLSAKYDSYGAGAGAGTEGAGFLGRYSRGTIAAPTTVAVGDRLGFNVFGGFTGVVFRHTAAINAIVDSGTVTSTSLPTYLNFMTTPDGSITRVERMRITSDGDVWIKTDSKNLLFGTAADMSITYNGTDGILKTNEVVPSDLIVDCGANKTLKLGTPVYQDINVGGMILLKPAASAPDIDTFVDKNGADTTIPTYAFAVGEYLSGGFELEHGYTEGTNLSFHVHWQGIAAPTGTDNVRWRLVYAVGRKDTPLEPAVTIDSPDTAFDTQYECKQTDFADIDGTGFKIGDQFTFSLYRVASTGDAYAGDALVQTNGIHCQQNTLGSRTVSTK